MVNKNSSKSKSVEDCSQASYGVVAAVPREMQKEGKKEVQEDTHN